MLLPVENIHGQGERSLDKLEKDLVAYEIGVDIGSAKYSVLLRF